jgi:hypothetical protein
LIRDTLFSLMYSPRRPKPPVVDPHIQSRNISVSDTKLWFVLLFWLRSRFWKECNIVLYFVLVQNPCFIWQLLTFCRYSATFVWDVGRVG